MESILAFTCAELNCYLDELTSKRRGDTIKKRRIATLVLRMNKATKKEISLLLKKDLSTIRDYILTSDSTEVMTAINIFGKYKKWKKRVDKEKISCKI